MEITTTVSVPIVISIPDAEDGKAVKAAVRQVRAGPAASRPAGRPRQGKRPNPKSDRIRVWPEARETVNRLLGDLGDTYMDVATNLILLGAQALRDQAEQPGEGVAGMD